MKTAKVERLQAAGWKVGNAEDFLKSSILIVPALTASGAIADRKGWYDGYQVAKNIDAWDKLTTTDAIGEEWEW